MSTSPILGKPVHDMLQVRGQTAALTVTGAAVEVKTGAERMLDRKVVVMYNNSTVNVEYGFSALLTYGQGLILPPGVQIEMACGERIPVFMIGPLGSSLNVRIAEGY